METQEVRWSEGVRLLFRSALEVSHELGHYEIVGPLHLLLALLTSERAATLSMASIREAMLEIAPPWEKGLVVMSPGGQTPSAKRIMTSAIGMATGTEQVEAEHVWGALVAHEPELVRTVFTRLGLATPKSTGDTAA